MKLELYRGESTKESTPGRLSINGVFEAFTLEDVIRPDGEKIAGVTCIPCGRYRIIRHISPKFGVVAMLVDVVNFSLVYIHWGNWAKDTRGCILVGKTRSRDYIGTSHVTFKILMGKLESAWSKGEEVWITIKNPDLADLNTPPTVLP